MVCGTETHMSARMKYMAVYVCVGSWLSVSRHPTRLQVSPSSHWARNQLLSASTDLLRMLSMNCGSWATSQQQIEAMPNEKPIASLVVYMQSLK